MKILLMIFFFGVAMSLIVLKGLFMSQEFAARTRQVRRARRRKRKGVAASPAP